VSHIKHPSFHPKHEFLSSPQLLCFQLDSEFASSCVPPDAGLDLRKKRASSGETPALSRSSSGNKSSRPPHIPPFINLTSTLDLNPEDQVKTPKASGRTKVTPDSSNRCARCNSKFFIHLKLPCGRVVCLCPTCTSDFRTHLGIKINQVFLHNIDSHLCSWLFIHLLLSSSAPCPPLLVDEDGNGDTKTNRQKYREADR